MTTQNPTPTLPTRDELHDQLWRMGFDVQLFADDPYRRARNLIIDRDTNEVQLELKGKPRYQGGPRSTDKLACIEVRHGRGYLYDLRPRILDMTAKSWSLAKLVSTIRTLQSEAARKQEARDARAQALKEHAVKASSLRSNNEAQLREHRDVDLDSPFGPQIAGQRFEWEPSGKLLARFGPLNAQEALAVARALNVARALPAVRAALADGAAITD